VNCGPRSNFLYIAITILLLLALLTFLHTITFYHSIRSILCLQQIGEIDNLIVSWAKYLVVLCAGSTLLLVQSKALDEAPYKLSGAVAKLASINLIKFCFVLLVR
jgi:hypothetical protein